MGSDLERMIWTWIWDLKKSIGPSANADTKPVMAPAYRQQYISHHCNEHLKVVRVTEVAAVELPTHIAYEGTRLQVRISRQSDICYGPRKVKPNNVIRSWRESPHTKPVTVPADLKPLGRPCHACAFNSIGVKCAELCSKY